MTTTGNDGEQSVLAGIRVLDLSGLAGQYTGRLLADLGADVIKIEPTGGDPVRSMPPFAGDQPGPDRGLRWLAYNSNKSSVVLSIITTPDGRDQQLMDMSRSDGRHAGQLRAGLSRVYRSFRCRSSAPQIPVLSPSPSPFSASPAPTAATTAPISTRWP